MDLKHILTQDNRLCAEKSKGDFESKRPHFIDGKFELGRLKHGDGKIVLAA